MQPMSGFRYLINLAWIMDYTTKHRLHIISFKYSVLNNKAYKLSMDQHIKLQKLQADAETPLQDVEPFRRLIGKLNYLTITRPLYICYIVQLLSKFMQKFMQSPTSVYMQAVKHLLRYLLNCHGQGVQHMKLPIHYKLIVILIGKVVV